ncbi:hypothetical protein DFP72DRAFT_853328 [Ephemerocybe angulata]|uniref:Uncharacterized protein n=1 Tax=Ephemerocybe angulata TaxID=980116 RepID=A0A8H6M1Z3_9AGAR|nr:hypothetical protein DFP72DRAFT_853328 [Tulosesus angulatus]
MAIISSWSHSAKSDCSCIVSHTVATRVISHATSAWNGARILTESGSLHPRCNLEAFGRLERPWFAFLDQNIPIRMPVLLGTPKATLIGFLEAAPLRIRTLGPQPGHLSPFAEGDGTPLHRLQVSSFAFVYHRPLLKGATSITLVMDQCNSVFSSLASASSSTLIVTPLPKGDDLLFSTQAPPRRRPPGVPMTRMAPPTRMSGKGFIEPHFSHLPRRVKKVPSRRSRSSSGDTNRAEGGFESKGTGRSPSRDPIERRPIAEPVPSSAPISRQAKHPGQGPLQPHVSNLPRRHARRPHSIAHQREERLCLQEIGAGSRIFVGLSRGVWKGEAAAGSSSDEDDEEEEDSLKQRYAAIVRLVTSDEGTEDDAGSSKDAHVLLRLPLPKSEPDEAGCTQLTARQLRLACSFLYERHRPVLILARPMCAIDAFSIALCFHASASSISTSRRPVSPGIPPLTPRTEDVSHAELPLEDEYSAIHQLAMKLHDEDLLVIDDENGKRSGRGDLKPGASGLRNEWRGLLRYEGIAMLDGIWKPSPAC